METKKLPPYAPTLIESTRAIGYSLEAAVADIIDNSIAANADKVDIFFFPIDGAYIAVLDNGNGMNEEELNLAMQYGSKNPSEVRDTNNLVRFGLGLKTASLSQCRCFSVVTKQGDIVRGRCWDIDHVMEVWQKLDRLKAGEIKFELVLGRKIDDVREHLTPVYHRYLSGVKMLKYHSKCLAASVWTILRCTRRFVKHWQIALLTQIITVCAAL